MNLLRSLSVPAILLPAVAFAADSQPAKKPVSEPAGAPSVERQLRQNPDDVAIWNRYLGSSFRPLIGLVNSNPAEAQRRVDAMKQFVNSLQPSQDEAKRMLARTKWTLGFWEQRIQLARTSRVELEAKLAANADDGPTVLQYAEKVRTEVLPLVYLATDRAEQKLKSATAFLEGVRARVKEGPAKKALEGADKSLAGLQHHIDSARQAAKLARMPRVELEAKLDANPDDGAAIATYGQKLWMELGPVISRDPARAEQALKSARTFLNGLRPKVKDLAAQKSLEGAEQSLARLQSWIDRTKQRAALIGKDAAPLEVEAWVNGTPLTAADLKGKVVLLDFFAVWFGPSIATFPHLRAWQEKYADKGLVIVGLTRYFNHKWDEKANRPVPALGKEKVAPEKEREMLVKFAERHRLPYRFAIEKGKALPDYYVVHRIPHVVLIDREGKIRLIRAGSDPRNVSEIQQMLEQLIAAAD